MKHERPPLKIHTPGLFVDEPQPGDLVHDTDAAARYFDVDGPPVSFGRVKGCPFRCAQWADGRPRIFSEARVHERGKPISEAAFRDLIAACRLRW